MESSMIRFRAKDKKNNLWVEGSYVYAHKYFETGEAGHFIYNMYGNDRVLVDEKTICQFTGMQDKLKRDIFDKDILRRRTYGEINLDVYSSEKEMKEHKRYLIKKCGCVFEDEIKYHRDYYYVVEFKNGCFEPFNEMWETEWSNFSKQDFENCEVIGNLVDNEKFLEDLK